MRLIDADALKELRHKYIQGQLNFDGNEYDLIDMCPTVDAELVKRGKWIKTTDEYSYWTIFMCSVCNDDWVFDIEEDVKKINYKYCPNCGAKMEKEVSENEID